MEIEEIVFTGRAVVRLFKNNDFYIYKMRLDFPDPKISGGRKDVVIKGNFGELRKDLRYMVSAKEGVQKRKEKTYDVQFIVPDRPKSKEDTMVFLKEILTKQQTKTICKVYPNFVNMIIEGREDEIDLDRLYGIGPKRFQVIKRKILENYIIFEIIAEFDGMFRLSIIKKLYDKYPSKEMIRKNLEKNPYTCLCAISGIGFLTADEILLKAETHFKKKGKEAPIKFQEDLLHSKDRCLAYIYYALGQNEKQGNTRILLQQFLDSGEKNVPECMGHFNECIINNAFYKYEENEKEYLCYLNTFVKEGYIVKMIIRSLAIKNTNVKWKAVKKSRYTNGNGFQRSKEQLKLIDYLKKYNTVILNGPAGTGKSATTEEVIELAEDQKMSYILLSPTGKAAKVLASYTGKEAMTVHRGLGFQDGEFLYNEGNKLDTDIVIIDEFSMVDVFLLYHLLKAVDPQKTKLIFVGDDAQIPSVGCGNLLHDFLYLNIIPNITLKKVYRYKDNGIMRVATDMRKGRRFLPSGYSIQKNAAIPIGKAYDYVFYQTEDEEILRKLCALYNSQLKRGRTSEEIQVLTGYNKGDFGAVKLNQYLRQLANPKTDKDPFFKAGEEKVFYKGDFVIQTKNNYKAPLFDEFLEEILSNDKKDEDEVVFVANGETGYIVDIQEDKAIINFDGNVVKYDKTAMQSVLHAYAITYHKSQGSSIKSPIILTPRAHTYMLNANLMYVGVSRAKEKCFHIGNAKTVNLCIQKKADQSRQTNIGYLYQMPMEELDQF